MWRWLSVFLCVCLWGCASNPAVDEARRPLVLTQSPHTVLLGFWDGRWAVGSWWNDFSLYIQTIEQGRIKGVWSAQGTPLGAKAINQSFDDAYQIDAQGRLLWTPRQFPDQTWAIDLSEQAGRQFLSWQVAVKDDVFKVELIKKLRK